MGKEGSLWEKAGHIVDAVLVAIQLFAIPVEWGAT